jgi:hypothetical protein
MSINKVKVSEAHERLMLAIGETIRIHTTTNPMPLEGIVGVLAFCAGAAIGTGEKNRFIKGKLKDMACANIEFGMEATGDPASSLILPESMN